MRNSRTLRRALLRARRDTGFVAAGIPLHLALVPLWSWGVTSVMEANDWGVVPMPFVLFLVGVPTLTVVQRHRYRAFLGVDVPRLTPTPTPQRRWPKRALRWLSSAQTWRQVGYHLLLGPLLAALEMLVLAAWAVAVAGATVYGWAWAVPVEELPPAFAYTTSSTGPYSPWSTSGCHRDSPTRECGPRW